MSRALTAGEYDELAQIWDREAAWFAAERGQQRSADRCRRLAVYCRERAAEVRRRDAAELTDVDVGGDK